MWGSFSKIVVKKKDISSFQLFKVCLRFMVWGLRVRGWVFYHATMSYFLCFSTFLTQIVWITSVCVSDVNTLRLHESLVACNTVQNNARDTTTAFISQPPCESVNLCTNSQVSCFLKRWNNPAPRNSWINYETAARQGLQTHMAFK